MGNNELISTDLDILYTDLFDVKIVFRGVEISAFFDRDYEVQSVKEKIIRVMSKDVTAIDNTDVISIDNTEYKVISFQKTADGSETIIGLEI